MRDEIRKVLDEYEMAGYDYLDRIISRKKMDEITTKVYRLLESVSSDEEEEVERAIGSIADAWHQWWESKKKNGRQKH